MPTLFDPIKIGDLELPNRIFMAPLTRCRAVDQRIPNELMVEYYAQRASAGLIFSEATSISPMGVGYPDTPGIWSSEQVVGWKRITNRVHEQGGKMLSQLWHVGRISDPIYLNGVTPIAPSAIRPAGYVNQVHPKKEFVTPRALDLGEIPGIIEEYRKAAINAKEAGFDAVEIHSANGYLLDQFLQDSTNKRTDGLGGMIANRARLLLRVVDAVISVWGKDRVGVHLAPRGDSNSMGDSNPRLLFGFVAQQLGRRKIAFICARESIGPDRLGPELKKAFGGIYIANEGFTKESAQAALDAGEADAFCFGKQFLANPDLPERFANNAPLNTPDPATFYGSGKEGYTDYPSLVLK